MHIPRWYQNPSCITIKEYQCHWPSQGATSFAARTPLILPNESI